MKHVRSMVRHRRRRFLETRSTSSGGRKLRLETLEPRDLLSATYCLLKNSADETAAVGPPNLAPVDLRGETPWAPGLGWQLSGDLFVAVPDSLTDGDLQAAAAPVGGATEVEQAESLAPLAGAPPGQAPYGATAKEPSEYMIGDVWVTLVLFESTGAIDPQTEDWTETRITRVKNEVLEGAQWWQDTLLAQFPNSRQQLNISVDFTYADTPVPTPYEPINHGIGNQNLWIDSFLNQVGHNTAGSIFTDLDEWNHDQRLAHNCDWAMTVFVVDSYADTNGMFADGYFSYAYLGGPFLTMTYDNDGWGINRMGQVFAHEFAHTFYALDEYPSSNSYTNTSGYYNVPNLNAYDGNPNPSARVPSLMAEASLQSIAYSNHTSSPTSLQMIGWRDSDNDNVFDVLDVPLTLTGSGSYNAEAGQYSFSGWSNVNILDNLNPCGYRRDITLNTVDTLQYRIDAGSWTCGGVYGAYTTGVGQTLDVSALQSGSHTIQFRTVVDGLGVSSNLISDSFTVNGTSGTPVANDDVATVDEDQSVLVPVLANDTDPDGDRLSVQAVTQGALGVVLVNANGTVTYTPHANAFGSDSFNYTVYDGRGGTATAVVRITVHPVNDPPLAGNDSATTNENTPVTVSVLANDSDVDGDLLTVAAVTQGTNGMVVIGAAGSVSYTPNAGFVGNDSFIYVTTDGQGGTGSAIVYVTVRRVQHSPVANDDAATVDEDQSVLVPVLANDMDPDGDPLNVQSVTQGTRGTVLVNADGTVTYTPDANAFGSDSFNYTISDGRGGTATAVVRITVQPVNDPPLAGNDSATTNENTPVTVSVLANDSDVDGDLLTVAAVTQGAGGMIVIGAAGSVTYTPNAGFVGNDSFIYVTTDGRGGTGSAIVYVTVRRVQHSPVANDDTATVDEDQSVLVPVLANDTDPDGDPLSVQSVTQGAQGAVLVNADGTVTYTPHANTFGSDSFNYTVCDGRGGTAMAAVRITVHAVNDPPLAGNDSATTNENTPVTVSVLANDSDVDGDLLTVAAVTQGTNGMAVIGALGTVTYTPNAGFTGNDSFLYVATDGRGGTGSAIVYVTVRRVQHSPVANDDAVTVDEDQSVLVPVLANDTDPDGDPLSVQSATQGTLGAVLVNADGTVTYTPHANTFGSDSFNYTVSDGRGGTAMAAVRITVHPVNDPPLAGNDSATTNENTPVTISVLANDSDVDGDLLTVAAVTQGTNGMVAIGAGGSVTYTPNAGFAGNDSFTYTAADGRGGTGTATVSVRVQVPVSASAKFFVVDNSAGGAFRYGPSGAYQGQSDLAAANTDARGIATSADGTRIWVLDFGKVVYVYGGDGGLLGSWSSSQLKQPTGIATDGSNLWIVDKGARMVFRYDGAASVTSGVLAANASFSLASGNRAAEGIATDGVKVWVVNSANPDRVYVYNASGSNLGNWSIDSANGSPTGLAIDPTNASQNLWIVDNATNRVYEYANGRSRTLGTQAASTSFALDSGNTSPQDIADPDGSLRTATTLQDAKAAGSSVSGLRAGAAADPQDFGVWALRPAVSEEARRDPILADEVGEAASVPRATGCFRDEQFPVVAHRGRRDGILLLADAAQSGSAVLALSPDEWADLAAGVRWGSRIAADLIFADVGWIGD